MPNQPDFLGDVNGEHSELSGAANSGTAVDKKALPILDALGDLSGHFPESSRDGRLRRVVVVDRNVD